MYGQQYSKYPEIILDSFRDINDNYSTKGKLNLKNPILRSLISTYIKVFGIPDISFQLRAKYFKDILDTLPNFKPLQILDAGCGIGYYSQQLKLKYPHTSIVGVDSDSHKISFCKKLAVKDCTFELSDLVKLTKPLNKYDLIVNIDVLEHIKDYHTVLKNFHHLLAPSGYLYIHTPQKNQHRTFKSFFDGWHHEDHVREGFTENELISELKKLGYKNITFRHGIGGLNSLIWEINQILLSFNFVVAGLLFPFLYLLTKFENTKDNHSGLTCYILCQK